MKMESRVAIKVGQYDPPVLWEPSMVIVISPHKWQKLVADIQAKGEFLKFKGWLRGKLIIFTYRGQLPAKVVRDV